MTNKEWLKFFLFSIIAITLWSVPYLWFLKALDAPFDKWAMLGLYVNPVSLSILTTALIFAIKDILKAMDNSSNKEVKK